MTVSVSVSNPAEWLKAELEAVEETLAESAASEVELLHSAARHILDAGGKRLRPQLTLLAARSVGYDGARAIALARRIRSGTFSINGGNYFSADTPFGGFKQSGVGREMGVAGLEEFLERKTFAAPVLEAIR